MVDESEHLELSASELDFASVDFRPSDNVISLAFTPKNKDVGDHNFTLRLTDKDGNFSDKNLSFRVSNTNDAPVLEAITDKATNEDAAFSHQHS